MKRIREQTVRLERPRWGNRERIVTAAGLAVFFAVFLYWWCTTAHSPAARAAACVSAALFAGVAVRLVPGAFRAFWDGEAAAAGPAEDRRAERLRTGRVFVSLLAVQAGVLLLVWIVRLSLGYRESFLESLSFWHVGDSDHYLDIARDWYLSEGDWSRLVQLVFLPGYPCVLRLVASVCGDFLAGGGTDLDGQLCCRGRGAVPAAAA